MRKKRKKLLQKQNETYVHFKELFRYYVELENKLKALKENSSEIDSENNQNFHR